MDEKMSLADDACQLLEKIFRGGSVSFAPALQGLAQGEHVVVSGLPSSGKTVLAAAVMSCWGNSVVLSGSGDQAKRVTRLAFDLLKSKVAGESRSFASAVLGYFNTMRRERHRFEVRLVSDAEVLEWMEPWVRESVPAELREASESDSFRQSLLDGIFRIRCEEKRRELTMVAPWIVEILEKLRERAKLNETKSGEHPWELDAGSMYEQYLRALDEGNNVSQPDLVVVDDWQNSNGLMQEILVKWAESGTQVLALGLPDLSCNEYRGAVPQALAELSGRLRENPRGRKVREVSLKKMQSPPWLQDFWRETVNLFGATGQSADLWKPEGSSGGTDEEKKPVSLRGYLSGVHILEASSDVCQYRLIGEFFQKAHIFSQSPLPYTEMAVLVISNAVGDAVEKQLKGMGIPVCRPGANSKINTGRFSVWLLKLLKLVCAQEINFDEFMVTDFLQSEFYGWSSADLRQLDDFLKNFVFPFPDRQDFSSELDFDEAVAQWELETNRLGALPWVKEFWNTIIEKETLFYGQAVADLCSQSAVADLVKVHQVMLRAQSFWEKDHGNVQMVLWTLWDSLGRAKSLQDLSFNPVLDLSVREQLNLDLDLVMDLFKAADWYEQRYPNGDGAEFAEKMLNSTLPTGTVAPHHQNFEAVTITTPTAAVSRHWKVVALAGLNEGVWPSANWPGDMLGTSMFDLYQEWKGDSESIQAGFDWSFRMDLRRFFAAITRAGEILILGANSNGLETPSLLLSRLKNTPVVDTCTQDKVSAVGAVEPSLLPWRLADRCPANIRSAIAYLRWVTMLTPPEASECQVSEAQRQEAARLLAMMGKSENFEVNAANPLHWAGGWRLTGTESKRELIRGWNETGASGGTCAGLQRNHPPQGTPIYRVRASGLEGLLNNPFDTEMSRLGFQDEQDTEYNPAVIGTIIHKVAEEMGQRHWRGTNTEDSVDFLDYASLVEEARGILNRLVQEKKNNWVFENFANRLNYFLTRLTEFLYMYQYPSLFECGYEMTIPSTTHQGAISYVARIDRILFTPLGIVLADYKTGNAANFSAEKTRTNLQLLLYQKAFNDGRPLGGAPGGLTANAAWIVALGGDMLAKPVTGLEPNLPVLRQKAQQRVTLITGKGLGDNASGKYIQIRKQDSLANYFTKVNIATPLTGEHRLILQNSQLWLEKKRRGETDFGPDDPESMTLHDFLQDRVNLAVSALGGERIVQRQETAAYYKPDLLPVEVESYE